MLVCTDWMVAWKVMDQKFVIMPKQMELGSLKMKKGISL